MKIAYLNAKYKINSTAGGHAHVGQFVRVAHKFGHEIWMDPDQSTCHPLAEALPANKFALLGALRKMDCIYIRMEWLPPRQAMWAMRPYRRLFGDIPMVWEFNTVAEYGRVLGKPERDVQYAIKQFQHYGKGCDLAICVTEQLAEYVRSRYSINHTLYVSNGSDPELFRPDTPPVKRMQHAGSFLNVVWTGSAYLPWHNIEVIKQAADWLWHNGYGCHVMFHIIGEKLSDISDFPLNVQYHGSVPYESLPAWLSQMDVGLVFYHDGPSMMGSPLKFFDYLASGLAVVCGKHPQVNQIMQSLDCSDLIINDADGEVLAEKLLTLSNNRTKLAEYGRIGRQAVVEQYNWEHLVRRIFAAIPSRSLR